MFNQILMVCVGNICRSPSAEYLLKQLNSQAGGKLHIHSAGVGALVGKPVRIAEIAGKIREVLDRKL